MKKRTLASVFMLFFAQTVFAAGLYVTPTGLSGSSTTATGQAAGNAIGDPYRGNQIQSGTVGSAGSATQNGSLGSYGALGSTGMVGSTGMAGSTGMVGSTGIVDATGMVGTGMVGGNGVYDPTGMGGVGAMGGSAVLSSPAVMGLNGPLPSIPPGSVGMAATGVAAPGVVTGSTMPGLTPGIPGAAGLNGNFPAWQNQGLSSLPNQNLPLSGRDALVNQFGRPGNGVIPQPNLLPGQLAPDFSEPSSAEKAMSAEDEKIQKPQPFRIGKLTQFGYNFFRQPTSFAPQVDIPVGPDYLLGPGDTIILTVWGSVDMTLPLEVNRSGEVVLPRVGAARVWGVPFGKVSEVLRSALSRTFKNVQLNVTMGKLRLMKVYVVGEVSAPGDYDISALSTVINALSAAGGPTKEGSLRSIQVLRGGKVVENVDLYDFFLKGDKSHDIRLRPGDTINVPVHGKLVGIAGNARKPAIYELIGQPTLKDVIDLAGGVSADGYLQRIQISRVVQNQKKVVADLDLDLKLTPDALQAHLAQVQLQDMDLVRIFPIDFTVRNNVVLDGYVLRPGGYALKPGMRLADVATRDNMLPEYWPETVELTRLVLPDHHTERLYLNLRLAQQGDTVQNILLQEFDTIRVFSRWEMEEIPKARISGDVQNPGVYRIFPNTTLRDLVLAAGNVKKTAFLKSTEISRSLITKDGVKSRLINVDLDLALRGDPTANLPLENFDEVMVRRLPEWKEETDRYCTLTGEVRFPGVYPIVKGEHLSSLIERAGGYTGKAYLKAAKFTRKLTRELQQKRMDEVIERTERELTRKQQELVAVASSKDELEATKATLESMKTSLDKLKQAKAEGRVSLELTPLERLKGSAYDLELQGGDTLDIPQSTNSVMIFGEVYNPTTAVETPGQTVQDYLKKAGGPTASAEEMEMYVVRADGTVVSRREVRGFFFDSFLSMKLDAGDTIVVPQRLEKVAWMREIKDIAYILGQTALAAGVLVAAGL
ncbi:hypothetical protein GMST_17270 [Geomonas silvestris]|uniref:Sugar ABC transporter substrate-binding protein n=2 Tax=Geomonas silvestris TaxID=2740184 RepID=A0A6V8MHH5_9BACT|nr:hypothetical protein GMST_17270 [Geomonas silvestris]